MFKLLEQFSTNLKEKFARQKPETDLPLRLTADQYVGPKGIQNLGFDQHLLWVSAALILWGCIMVYSTTIALPTNPKFSGYTPSHFILRHLSFVAVALIASWRLVQIPMRFWNRYAVWIFLAALVLLVLVLIPGVGRSVKGARRWIPLGIINFQPSELAKLAMVFYVSNYLVRKTDLVRGNFFRIVTPVALAVGLVGGLLLFEPDMGAFLVIAIIAMSILFLSGVDWRMFAVIAIGMVLVFVLIIYFSDWRRERIFAYLQPWDPKYVLGKGYQLTQALIAIGRGGIFGVGLGGSVEKLHWLPEAHTDFLLAIIGEEFGFIGILCIISLFFWLVKRIVHIGRRASLRGEIFSGLVAQGIGIWIGFQAFINIGVNLGALPTKGLTLPLMSYGGSAIAMNILALAVVLRIDYENRAPLKGDA